MQINIQHRESKWKKRVRQKVRGSSESRGNNFLIMRIKIF